MCGFFFNTAFDYAYNLKTNINRFNKLQHRGVDNSSYEEIFFNKKYFLGHHRLSINDIGHRSNQPMKSMCDKYYILFNGEIFNFKKLKTSINYQFHTKSDTEVILIGYKTYGKDFIKNLEGFFSILLLDLELKKIIISVDPTSSKSIYYENNSKSLSIASELNSFIPNQKSQIIDNLNHTALQIYLQYGYVHAPHSIYKNIYKLEPGELIEFELDTHHATYYKKFNKHFSKKSKKNINQLIIDAHETRLVSDVPIATLLSSGVDSTLTNFIYKKFLNNNEKVYTLGLENSDLDESKIALRQTKKLNLNHKIIKIDKLDIINEFKKVSNYLDEPFADSSSILVSILSKEISKDYKVAISSDGGDELLYGYSRHRFHKLFFVINKIPFFFKKIILKIIFSKFTIFFLNLFKINHLEIKLNKINSFFNETSYTKSYLNLLKIIPDLVSNKILLNYKEDYLVNSLNKKLNSIKDIDYNLYLPSINFKNDRCGMQSSLEIREPMLNFDLVRHFYEDEMTIKDIIFPKNIFRNLLKKNLIYIKKKKQGFSFSQKEILEYNNYELLILFEKNLNLLSDLFDINFIFKMIHDFKEKRKWTTEIWVILSFTLWLKNKVQ